MDGNLRAVSMTAVSWSDLDFFLNSITSVTGQLAILGSGPVPGHG
jgi:hypothetical protein